MKDKVPNKVIQTVQRWLLKLLLSWLYCCCSRLLSYVAVIRLLTYNYHQTVVFLSLYDDERWFKSRGSEKAK